MWRVMRHTGHRNKPWNCVFRHHDERVANDAFERIAGEFEVGLVVLIRPNGTPAALEGCQYMIRTILKFLVYEQKQQVKRERFHKDPQQQRIPFTEGKR